METTRGLILRGRYRTQAPRSRAALIALAMLASAPVNAVGSDVEGRPPTDDDGVNYSVGYAFGAYLAGLKRQGTEVDIEAVLKGALDALSGAEPLVGEAERQRALEGVSAALAQDPAPQQAMVLARTRGHVDDFAVLNAKRPGVVVLPSGVQYEVLNAGGGRQPDADDTVAISYEGSLSTGVVFDTTYDDGEPLQVRVAELAVPGLREALLRMREGDKWRVVVPPAMGFGKTGNNQLRKRDLVYEIELVSVAESKQETLSNGGESPAGDMR